MRKVSQNKFLIILFILFLFAGLWRIVFRIWPGLKPAFVPSSQEQLIEAVPKPGIASHDAVSGRVVSLPLTLPDSFTISLYADKLAGPRVIVFDKKGRMLISETKAGNVLLLIDSDSDGFAETHTTLLSGLHRPHGLALYKDWLYVAETDSVKRYQYDVQSATVMLPGEAIMDLPQDGRHFTRTIGFGPDELLYVSIGSSCDTCLERDERRATIMRAHPDGTDARIFATGLRNSVFFAWHPKTGELYATDMGRDNLGDDLPPDEINIVHEGGGYGWPFCYGKQIYDTVFRGVNNCEYSIPPLVDLPAHVAPLGIAFVPASWGSEWENDILVANHGSWNRSVPVGYNVVRFNAEDNYQTSEEVIAGWLTSGDSAFGRPVAIAFDGAGRLYISDDKAGVIYQIVKE